MIDASALIAWCTTTGAIVTTSLLVNGFQFFKYDRYDHLDTDAIAPDNDFFHEYNQGDKWSFYSIW